ncbi:hypothetical protein CLOP_g14794 [Closterium sp. NIES-67]|nr:hypothetical protein CLOP_g14794 [Closterium sp. NIES-67]
MEAEWDSDGEGKRWSLGPAFDDAGQLSDDDLLTDLESSTAVRDENVITGLAGGTAVRDDDLLTDLESAINGDFANDVTGRIEAQAIDGAGSSGVRVNRTLDIEGASNLSSALGPNGALGCSNDKTETPDRPAGNAGGIDGGAASLSAGNGGTQAQRNFAGASGRGEAGEQVGAEHTRGTTDVAPVAAELAAQREERIAESTEQAVGSGAYESAADGAEARAGAGGDAGSGRAAAEEPAGRGLGSGIREREGTGRAENAGDGGNAAGVDEGRGGQGMGGSEVSSAAGGSGERRMSLKETGRSRVRTDAGEAVEAAAVEAAAGGGARASGGDAANGSGIAGNKLGDKGRAAVGRAQGVVGRSPSEERRRASTGSPGSRGRSDSPASRGSPGSLGSAKRADWASGIGPLTSSFSPELAGRKAAGGGLGEMGSLSLDRHSIAVTGRWSDPGADERAGGGGGGRISPSRSASTAASAAAAAAAKATNASMGANASASASASARRRIAFGSSVSFNAAASSSSSPPFSSAAAPTAASLARRAANLRSHLASLTSSPTFTVPSTATATGRAAAAAAVATRGSMGSGGRSASASHSASASPSAPASASPSVSSSPVVAPTPASSVPSLPAGFLPGRKEGMRGNSPAVNSASFSSVPSHDVVATATVPAAAAAAAAATAAAAAVEDGGSAGATATAVHEGESVALEEGSDVGRGVEEEEEEREEEREEGRGEEGREEEREEGREEEGREEEEREEVGRGEEEREEEEREEEEREEEEREEEEGIVLEEIREEEGTDESVPETAEVPTKAAAADRASIPCPRSPLAEGAAAPDALHSSPAMLPPPPPSPPAEEAGAAIPPSHSPTAAAAVAPGVTSLPEIPSPSQMPAQTPAAAAASLLSPSRRTAGAAAGAAAGGATGALPMLSPPTAAAAAASLRSPTAGAAGGGGGATAASSPALSAGGGGGRPRLSSRELRVMPGPDVRGTDDTRADLRSQRIRSLMADTLHLPPAAQFVYLRGNQLAALDGIERVKRVKVLDVSYNQLGDASLAPLAACTALQQLFLAGNRLSSLASLPRLPSLEFLSVSQNALCLLDMPSQPRLKVLTASSNSVASFEGFPLLPALEHLRLDDNPIEEAPAPHFAAILLAASSLLSFNASAISEEERGAVEEAGGGHGTMCVRMGWLPASASIGDIPASLVSFLAASWAPFLPTGYALASLLLDRPIEDCPCHCRLLLRRNSGGGQQGEDCEDGEEGEGDWEREREGGEGEAEGEGALEAWPSGVVVRYEWLRRGKGATEFSAIDDAEGELYTPTYSDVHACLAVRCTPLLHGRPCTPLLLTTTPVAPGPGIPRVQHVSLGGEAVEGGVLTAMVEVGWSSGEPGPCQYSWSRLAPSHSQGAAAWEEVQSGGAEYPLSLHDVGCVLRLSFTPVSARGVRGEPASVTSLPIAAAPPQVLQVAVEGEALLGGVLRARGTYFGGAEGSSVLQWFREEGEAGEEGAGEGGGGEGERGEGEENGAGIGGGDAVVGAGGRGHVRLVPVGEGPQYEAQAGDVGRCLLLRYTPVASSGLIGEPVTARSPIICLPLPRASDVTIEGPLVEGGEVRVRARLQWADEGRCEVAWFFTTTPHALSTADLQPITAERPNCMSLTVPLEAIGSHLAVRLVPVRADGVKGRPVVAVSSAPVQEGEPQVLSVDMEGEEEEGGVLVGYYTYQGGAEGDSLLEWYRYPDEDGQPGQHGELVEDEDSDRMAGGGMSRHVPTASDVGGFLSFRVTPVRSDGATGAPQAVCTAGPIRAALPSVSDVWVEGDLVEGGRLVPRWTYAGQAGQYPHPVMLPDMSDKRRMHPSKLTHPAAAGAVGGERGTEQGEGEGGEEEEGMRVVGEEVGRVVAVVCVPVRDDGEEGAAVESAPVGPVMAAPPACVHLEVDGDMWHGGQLSCRARYHGGQQGESRVAWVRVTPAGEEQLVGRQASYTLTADDVGCRMRVEFTPVRADGVAGEMAALTTRTVTPDQRVCIAVLEGGVLQAGGELLERAAGGEGGGGEGGVGEGEVWVVWYRRRQDGRMVRIDGATGLTYVPQEADYGCCVVAGCRPRLPDGTWGDEVLSAPGPIVLPELSDEEAVSLEVQGRAEVGAVLHAVHAVSPALEPFVTAVHVQWWQASSGSDSHQPIDGATSPQLPVAACHVGAYLLCSATVLDSFARSFNSVATTATPVVAASAAPVNATPISATPLSPALVAAVPVAGGAAAPTTPCTADGLPASDPAVPAPPAAAAAAAADTTVNAAAAGADKAAGMQRAQQQQQQQQEEYGGGGEGETLLEGGERGVHGGHEQWRAHRRGGEREGGHVEGGGGERESRVGAEAAAADGALRISGGPFHTSLFHLHLPAAPPAPAWLRLSSCAIQWFRVPPGGFHALDPHAIPGATGTTYHADVADSHQCLMVEVRPLHAHGDASQLDSGAASQSQGGRREEVLRVLSEQVLVDPAVARDVDLIVAAGGTKVETHDVGRSGRREHRVVDANRKRFKVVKLTALAAISRVEVRATYDPPFRVETERGQLEHMRIVVSTEKEVELTLPSQRARDVMVLCLRAFVQLHRTAKHH